MYQEEVNISVERMSFSSKVSAYTALMKLRLAWLVVFSAILGYMLAPGEIVWMDLLFLGMGGFLVTGSSNSFNQVWEKDLDKKMERTKNRPMPQGKLSIVEALVFSSLIGIIGILSLWQLNPLSAILGMLALASYVLIYTPLKTITPLSVFVGAFPGSVPPMLGYVAASGGFGLEAGILFLTQFFWQFPHFWSIAWKLHDDYQKGGFWMLPSLGGRDKKSAYQILLYTAALIPVGMLPWVIDMTGIVSAIIAIVFGILMCAPAFKLYKTLDTKFAKQLMFGSFLYLPLMLIVYLIDKI